MADEKDDIVLVAGPEGAISVELVPVAEGVARGFLRFSPRNLKPSEQMSRRLGEALSSRPYSRFLIVDTQKRILRKSLARIGWTVVPSVLDKPEQKCASASTYDVPSDEDLIEASGARPDLSGTSQMSGIRIEIDGRKAWAFYTDDGESVRIVDEGQRRQGTLIASSTDDIAAVTDCFVRYQASISRKWAVFSTSLGRFVRQFHPIDMWRMELQSPKPYEHAGVLVGKENKKTALRLFSEYYDESYLRSIMRLRRMRSQGNCWTYLVQGGFVIVRLEGETGLIYDIYVTPSEQGKGRGSELMKAALTSLVGRVSSVYLHTSFPRAKRLYEKFGFRTVYTQLGIRLDELSFAPPAER